MVALSRRVDQRSSGVLSLKVHKCKKRAWRVHSFLLSLISAVTEAIHWPVGVNYDEENTCNFAVLLPVDRDSKSVTV